AKVKKIIERKCKTLIGVLDNVNGFVTFKPIEPIYKNTSFRIKNIANEARILDVVVAEIINYENRNKEINIVRNKLINVFINFSREIFWYISSFFQWLNISHW
ncbi:hypothetical protein, partial [Mycoplasmopsis bovis]|uniref:hypothetical protein n=1 Tax=Mycoplasmopsis bovis TaxID=28903 RepID=UPI003D27A61A